MKIRIDCDSGPREVDADPVAGTDGVLAVHPPAPGDLGFAVTHVGTGMCVLRAPTAEQAHEFGARAWGGLSDSGREAFAATTHASDAFFMPAADHRHLLAIRREARRLFDVEGSP